MRLRGKVLVKARHGFQIIRAERKHWVKCSLLNSPRSKAFKDQAMRSNTVFEISGTAGQRIRAEIGRLLKQNYDVGLSPISDHLAEVIKKIEQSESQPVLAFRRGNTQ